MADGSSISSSAISIRGFIRSLSIRAATHDDGNPLLTAFLRKCFIITLADWLAAARWDAQHRSLMKRKCHFPTSSSLFLGHTVHCGKLERKSCLKLIYQFVHIAENDRAHSMSICSNLTQNYLLIESFSFNFNNLE